MQKRWRILIAFGLAVGLITALLLSACGGGGSTGTTATTTSGSVTTASSTTAPSSGETSTTVAGEPYKLGAAIDLTGSMASLGADIRDGIVLQVAAINAQGGINGHPLALTVADSGSSSATTAAVLTKLIMQDKVDAIIGPGPLGLTVPASQTTLQRDQVPSLIPGMPDIAQLAKGTAATSYSFTMAPDHRVQGQAIVKIVQQQGFKNVVGIGPLNSDWQGTLDVIKEGAPAAGFNFVRMTDTWTPGDVDRSSQAAKMKAEIDKVKADAVVIDGSGPDVMPMIKALHALGVNLPVIGDATYGLPAMFKAGGADIEGAIFPSGASVNPAALPDSNRQKTLLIAWAAGFQAKYGRAPSQMAATGYDVVNMYAAALKAVGNDKAKVRDYLENNIKDWVGAQGIFTFSPTNHEGLGLDSLVVWKIQGGKFVYVGDLGK